MAWIVSLHKGQVRSFWPLPSNQDIVWAAEAQVVAAADFLCSHAGVVEKPQEGIIALPKQGVDFDPGKNRLHLVPFQIFRHARGLALERNREDGLTV